jgi:hypothetical protein
VSGPDGSVGIATSYGLDFSGSNPCRGRDLSAPVQTGLVAHPASFTMGTGSFPEDKAAEASNWPPTPSSAEAKERVELQLYSPSGPSLLVIG